jgi:hypothetical protein
VPTFDFIFLAKSQATGVIQPRRISETAPDEAQAAAKAALRLLALIGPYELRRLESRRQAPTPQALSGSVELDNQPRVYNRDRE